MRLVLTVLTLATGALLGLVLYDRLIVDRAFGPVAVLAASALGCIFVLMLITLLLHGTRFRAVLVNIWLVIASVAIPYVAVDVIAGALLIQPLSPPLVPDQFRHHRLVPDSYSRFQTDEFDYIQRVNNLGLRGMDRALKKPSNSFRILMLGDSFTMGKGVNDDQTFSVLLEQSLNSRTAACSGPAIEILNGGVDSYAPILSYIQFERDLHQLEPDLVVLNLDVSDLAQERAYRNVAIYDDEGTPVRVPQDNDESASLTGRFQAWTENHLFVTRLVLFHVSKLFDDRDPSLRDVVTQSNFEVVAHTLASDTDNRDEQWTQVFDSILKIKASSGGRAMDFLLSIYPWGHQVSDTEWLPGRYAFMPKGAVASDRSLHHVVNLAAQSGVRLANLYPVFRSYAEDAPLYFKKDMHWTATGHKVMAQGLENHLLEMAAGSWCQ